jgi:hypothetical protein
MLDVKVQNRKAQNKAMITEIEISVNFTDIVQFRGMQENTFAQSFLHTNLFLSEL